MLSNVETIFNDFVNNEKPMLDKLQKTHGQKVICYYIKYIYIHIAMLNLLVGKI